MTLACLRPRVAGFALRLFAPVLLASCSTVFATPCDTLRRALTVEQRAKFGLSGQPCKAMSAPITLRAKSALASPESPAAGLARSESDSESRSDPKSEANSESAGEFGSVLAALVDGLGADSASATSAMPHIDAVPSALRRASQLALYDAERPLVVVPDVVPAPTRGMRYAPVAIRPGIERRSAGTPASVLRALSLSPEVDAAARRHDIDPLLLHAIAHVESRHNAEAVSRAGALGVMQVMPATARRFGIESASRLRDASTNLDVSAIYLKTLQRRFGNDLRLILAAYNAGEGAVERHGRRIPPFAETQRYVDEVLERYGALSKISRALGAALGTTPRPVQPTL
jgi:soluble lytic murein transglycosylase-like protein